jgi:formylglycine-generating enzyme required for sulfatase activity
MVRILCGLTILLSAFAFTACGEKDDSSDEDSKKTESKDGEDKTISLSDEVSMEMVWVKAGTFEMSAQDGQNSDDEVAHSATLKRDFYIGRTEVTQAQWIAVMGSNPSYFKVEKERPVEQVSWYEAMEFCEKLNDSGKAPKGWKFTLPTETQWEYAARGGKKSEGYKYSGSDIIDEVAWYTDNANGTHPVGQKEANELGLYDMSGNVWEWCLDDYQNKSDKLTAEFSRGNDKSDSRRVNRGGSWLQFGGAWFCRSASRYSTGPSARSNDLGFRVALVPESY